MLPLKIAGAYVLAVLVLAGFGVLLAVLTAKRKLTGGPLPYTTGDEAP